MNPMQARINPAATNEVSPNSRGGVYRLFNNSFPLP